MIFSSTTNVLLIDTLFYSFSKIIFIYKHFHIQGTEVTEVDVKSEHIPSIIMKCG